MSSKEFAKEADIWIVKFEKLKEFAKPFRPCVVVSNDTQNEFDDKIVVVPITADKIKNIEPFEVFIKNTKENGLEKPSKILCNYPHTIYKKLRIVGIKRIGKVSSETMERVKKSLKIVFNLGEVNF